MDFVLLNPAGLAALAAIAVPVIVHLLLRRRATRLPFPSLRFIPQSRAAAVRLQSITDWPLLLVRIAIVAAAALALARPLFITPSRREGWDNRIARAVVVDVSPSVGSGDGRERARRAAEEERNQSFRSQVIEAANLDKGTAEAIAWLSDAPPARRELVVISDFQSGALEEATILSIPTSVGVRLRSVPSALATVGAPDVRISVSAPQSQQHAVAAALDAIGQPREVSDDDHRARIVFVPRGASAPAGTTARLAAPWMGVAAAAVSEAKSGSVGDRTMVVRLDAAADSFELPLAMRAVRRALLAPAAWHEMEPDRLSDRTLATWSRPAPPIIAPDSRHVDEDDGRWLWAIAVGLLLLETWWRRQLDRAADKREISEGTRAA